MPEGIAKVARRKEKYQRRQSEVFDAAAAVFAEKGYHGASTGDIADRIGIAQSSLYYYFKSKDEALERVCLEGIKGYVERLRGVVDSNLSPAAKIRGAIENHIEPLNTIPDYFKTFTGELRYLPKSSRENLNRKISQYNRLFEEILAAGVVDKTFRGSLDCSLATLQLISQCNDVPFWINSSRGYKLDEIATSIADNFLQGVMAGKIAL